MKWFLLHSILLGFLFVSAQQKTQISCYAPSFKGQVASLVTYSDYISFMHKELDRGLVDSSGNVTFFCDPEEGMKTLIQIQDKSAILYLDPNAPKYQVSFPAQHENVQKLTGNTVRLVIDSLEKNDLNSLILEFNLRLDYFLYGDTLKIQRLMLQNEEFRDSLTQFTKETFEIYKDIDCRYFKDYFKYSIASVALFSNRQEPEKNKYVIFETFIKAKPILYHNDAYMSFIKDFYKDALSDIGFLDRDRVTFAINNASSLAKLDEAMMQHYYLKNNTYLELIMINALEEAYHTTFFNQENVRHLLNLIKTNSESPEHKKIANNVLALQELISAGTEAPSLQWIEPNGDTTTLKELRGKYVYLCFWATWNKPSIQEMMVIKQLQEKYHKYVEFVCISVDSDESEYEAFIKSNKKNFNWHFGYYRGDAKILNDFSVRNVPYYLLIDMEGVIEQSPAYGPSPNGTYKSIDETFFYIQKRLEPKGDFNVGKY